MTDHKHTTHPECAYHVDGLGTCICPTTPPDKQVELEELLVELFSKAGYLINSEGVEAVKEAKSAINSMVKMEVVRARIEELERIPRVQHNVHLTEYKDFRITELKEGK